MIKFVKGRWRSFLYAVNGIKLFFSAGTNMYINFTAVVVVSAAGFYFDITDTEWMLVILCFALNIAAEGFNTALEQLADLLHPEQHPAVGRLKDLAAGSVLVFTIASFIIAAIIFGKYIAAMF